LTSYGEGISLLMISYCEITCVRWKNGHSTFEEQRR